MTQLRQILEAVVTALNGASKPAAVPAASLWSGIQLEAADLPARFVAVTNEGVERAGSPNSPLVRRTATLVVQDLVPGTGSDGLTPQQVAEELRAWTVATLATNTYGGLAIDTIERSTEWVLEQGEEPFARVTHTWDITFTTKTTNAEARA